jgi:hypothetical protein
MSLSSLGLLASLFLGVSESAHVAREDRLQAAEDLWTLQATGLPTDGAALVRFLDGGRPAKEDKKHIAALIQELGDRSFKRREGAAAELILRGPRILLFLRRGLKWSDLETQRRLERCIKAIEHSQTLDVRVAAMRRLQTLGPEHALPVLFAEPTLASSAAQHFCLARFSGDLGTVRRLTEISLLHAVNQELHRKRQRYTRAYTENAAEWGRVTASVRATVCTVRSGVEGLKQMRPHGVELLRLFSRATAYLVHVEVRLTYRNGTSSYALTDIAVLVEGTRSYVIAMTD